MADTLQALCMKCRVDNKPQMREMTNPVVSVKNNRYSAKGQCGECGGNMFKFMNKETAEAAAGDAGIQEVTE